VLLVVGFGAEGVRVGAFVLGLGWFGVAIRFRT